MTINLNKTQLPIIQKSSLPKDFKVLIRKDNEGKEKLVETHEMPDEIPEGHVLVKLAYAPINPSDMMTFLNNSYGHKEKVKQAPIVPGFEGSGTVVKVSSGGDDSLVGKKVGIMQNIYSDEFIGTWRQYGLYKMESLIIFPQEAELDKIHSVFVNPATVYLMLQESLDKGYTSVVFNAAGSSLCRMAASLFSKNNIKTIMIVRRDEHIKELKEKGATVVLNKTTESFDKDLDNAIKEYKPLGFFDAVAGPDAIKIYKKLDDFSTTYNYGALSLKPFDGITAFDLIFHRKTLRYLFLIN